MTEIAEAYFHLRRVELSPDELQRLGDQASALAALTANDLFPPETIIDVRLEEGSLKGWITAIGLLTVYGHIADYKGFKESVAEMVSDARAFSEAVSSKIFSQKELKGSVIYRQERRTKTPGRIKRVIQKREWLDDHRAQLSKADVEAMNYEIERLLQLVLADVEPSERAALRRVLGEQEPHLPRPEGPRVALPPTRLEQVVMFDPGYEVGPEAGADYHRRFRLSDGPLTGVGNTPILPFKITDTKKGR